MRDTQSVAYRHLKTSLESLRVTTKMTGTLVLVFFAVLNLCVAEEYANEWIVTVEGGDVAAREIAESDGFINHGRVRLLSLY